MKGEKFVSSYVRIITPACCTCRHRSQTDVLTCAAFPAGIPTPILRGENDHRSRYDGDRGVMYDPK